MKTRIRTMTTVLLVLVAVLVTASAFAGATSSTPDPIAAADHRPPLGTLPRVSVGNTPQDAVFDPATHTVYVANQNAGTLSVVDARHCNARDTTGCDQTPATVAAGNGPFAIAIDDATHTLYVADSYSDTVSAINTASCNAELSSGCAQTPATIKVGIGPNGVAVDPATDTVYVANSGPAFSGTGNTFGDTVSVINGAICDATTTSGCGQTPATVKVGAFPFGVLLDPANGTLYVTNANDNTVSMINTTTCQAETTAGCAATPPTTTVGAFPVELAVDPHSGTVYVANNNQPTVSMLNGITCNATDTAGCRPHPSTLHVPGGPDGIAINPTTDTLFVANNGPGSNTARANTVSVIDAGACNALTTSGCRRPAPTVLTGANPGGNTIDPTTDTLYVTTFDNTLQVINAATCNATVRTGCGQSTPATLGGADAFSVAINPATHTVYVGDSGGTEGYPFAVSVLNAASCNSVTVSGCRRKPVTIPMKSNPYGVAVNDLNDTLYVTNHDNGNSPGHTVSVINAARCDASTTAGCAQDSHTISVGSTPAGIAVNQATDTAYVANSGARTVSVIDGAACNARHTSGCRRRPRTIRLAKSPLAVAVDQATDTIYVLEPGTPGTVAVIDGAKCNALSTSGCGTHPPTVTVGPDGRGVEGLAVDTATDTIYVVNTGNDTVSVIDGATCNRRVTSGCHHTPAQVAVGAQQFGFVAIDPATDLVYVTNELDDTVSIIDGTHCNATHTAGCGHHPRTVPAGGNPAGLAIDQTDHNIYVADNGNGPVSFFRYELPARPTHLKATAHHGQVTIIWQHPNDGGLPIRYRVIPSPSCPACRGLNTPTTTGRPFTTISGLTRGQRYKFAIQASDAAGRGRTSTTSNSITP
jgi:YVTN family beta-propeller protein